MLRKYRKDPNIFALEPMPEYKITYFDCRGTAEAARCCLHYAGIPFEDHQIAYKDWAQHKKSFLNQKLPVFYEDGKELTQSGAITRYVARLTGLNGKDSWEEAKADEIYHYFFDAMKSTNVYVHDKCGYNKAKDLNEAYEIFLPIATRALEYYNNFLIDSTNGFALKSGLTYADFVIHAQVKTFKNCDPELLKKFPKVVEHFEKIENIPQLQGYFATQNTIN
ncbi:unnamed protein product [Bursaphelenchus xylophilus]|uniref:(pine wood nematode) hypothetical protein n=1 Tax=Bursaphelenchus xylophilus TaxID=6326 RepID=A0A1I7SCC4_BURXY|nr:unnamed protein product [Bursaphelenchus xylophilus]CAG9094368.1 unnamed protein product [Bursaphelenchus xylophilus]